MDTDGNGTIEVSEFVAFFIKNGYDKDSWVIGQENRDVSCLPAGTELQRHLQLQGQGGEYRFARPKMAELHPEDGPVSPLVKELPPGLNREQFDHWTPVKIINAIQRKVQEKVSKHVDQVRQAYMLFKEEGTKDGISPLGVQRACARWGMVLTDEDVRALFRVVDKDGNGNVDLNEFVEGILLPDCAARGALAAQEAANMANHSPPLVPLEEQRSRKDSKWRFHMDQLVQKIRTKVEQHTSRGEDQVRQAYQLFCRNGTFTREVLRHQIQKFGVETNDEEIESLFAMLDDDNSGHIDFGEFMNGILPADYQDKHPRVTAQHADNQDSFNAAANSAAMPSGQNVNWLTWKSAAKARSHGSGGHSHQRSSFTLG